MTSFRSLLLAAIIYIITVDAGYNQPHGPCQSQLWPYPSQFTNGSTNMNIDPSSFKIEYLSSESQQVPPDQLPEVDEIAKRYMNDLLFPHESGKESRSTSDQTLQKLYIQVSSDFSTKLSMDTDESYQLTIPMGNDPTSALLEVRSLSGVVYGLETFSQLILYVNQSSYPGWCSSHEDGYFIANTPWEIQDQPRFKWRGLLVDVSRHFVSLPNLKSIIDALSYTKMNVLHLHIADSQSIPLVFNDPIGDLGLKGSYSGQERYSIEEMKELVEFASSRAVRVVPEYDTPGHTFSISYAYPELVVCADVQPNWSSCGAGPPCGQLDPTNNGTYTLVHEIMKQFGEIFDDNFMHLGYDEVNFGCWNMSDSIRKFMSDNGMNFTQLTQFYLTNQLKGLPQGKIPVFWEEVFELDLEIPENALIQVWSDLDSFKNVLENSNNPVLLSNSDALYLDCGMGSYVSGGPSWCDYNTWQDIYLNEPFASFDGEVPSEYLKRAYGGEVAMWSAQTDDANIVGTIWPRTAAAGERFWSLASVNDAVAALPRFMKQRQRMAERKVRASPVQPRWCNYNPGHCNSPQ